MLDTPRGEGGGGATHPTPSKGIEIQANSFFITETEQIPKIFSTSGVEEFLTDGVVVL
jgi:hypothetical protein